jgi:hypothetical protein
VGGGIWIRRDGEASSGEKGTDEEKVVETTAITFRPWKDHHASRSIGWIRIEGSDEPTSPRALFSTWDK